MTKRRRSGPDDPAPLLIRLPAKPPSLAVIRSRLRRWLPTAEVDAAAAAEVLLAVGEAASNAVEHATRGVSHEVELEVCAQAARSGIALTVRDNGHWRPPRRRSGRGHGNHLICALVDVLTITPSPHGTAVQMRRELPA